MGTIHKSSHMADTTFDIPPNYYTTKLREANQAVESPIDESHYSDDRQVIQGYIHGRVPFHSVKRKLWGQHAKYKDNDLYVVYYDRRDQMVFMYDHAADVWFEGRRYIDHDGRWLAGMLRPQSLKGKTIPMSNTMDMCEITLNGGYSAYIAKRMTDDTNDNYTLRSSYF